ncbi:MAG: LysR family transcriptional regulator [Oligoflexus sp.]
MDLRYLKAFVATAKLGSVSKAAESLNIAQSAVSRQIKLLEESTKQELLIRSSKNIVLTEKGRRLLLLTENFFQQSTQILHGQDISLLRIATVHGILETWLQVIIADFCQKKEHQLEIHITPAKELEQGLLQGAFDLVISPLPIRSDLISCSQIFDEHRRLVSREKINPERLEDYRWIVYNDEDLLFKLTYKKPKTYVQVNSITTILSLVEAGCGIAVLPTHVIGKGSNLQSYPLTRYPSAPIFIAHLSYHNLPVPMADLIRFIQEAPSPNEA